jgi:hypothetical protein
MEFSFRIVELVQEFGPNLTPLQFRMQLALRGAICHCCCYTAVPRSEGFAGNSSCLLVGTVKHTRGVFCLCRLTSEKLLIPSSNGQKATSRIKPFQLYVVFARLKNISLLSHGLLFD